MPDDNSPLHYFNDPDSCRLGKRVYKRLFYENTKLTGYDKKILKEDVDTVWWQLSFKPTTIPIPPYKDKKREYLEVALVEIALHGKNREARLSEIVHRAIPYPLILMFTIGAEVCFSSADKRFSEAERDAVIAEGFRLSDWIDLDGPLAIQAEFLNSLDVIGWRGCSQRRCRGYFDNGTLNSKNISSIILYGIFSLKTCTSSYVGKRDR